MLLQNGDGSQRLLRHDVARARHHDVRLDCPSSRGPLPNADALGTVDDGIFHVEVLTRWACLSATITFT